MNIHSGQVCQHRKKNRKSNVHSPRNLNIHLIFLTDLVCIKLEGGPFLGFSCQTLSANLCNFFPTSWNKISSEIFLLDFLTNFHRVIIFFQKLLWSRENWYKNLTKKFQAEFSFTHQEKSRTCLQIRFCIKSPKIEPLSLN